MLPRDPRLRMTAANGSEIQNLGVKMIEFRRVAMGEDEFEVDTEGEPGERKAKKMQDPKMPTRTEIEEHNLTHLPFRSWCRHCVRGRGKELTHERVGEQGEMPELHVDMCFLGEEKDPHNTITVMVARQRSTRMTMPRLCQRRVRDRLRPGGLSRS